MLIQIIDTKPITFRCENMEFEFSKPYYLIRVGELGMIKAIVKGSTMGWNIGNYFLTYNKFKKAIKNTKNESI